MKIIDPLKRFLTAGIFCLAVVFVLPGCRGMQTDSTEAGRTGKTVLSESSEETVEKEASAGLILTSRGAGENEEIVAAMQELAGEAGFRLVVYIPDVSAEEAEEAAGLEMGSFASCDVDPIEYQMLGVNKLVAEDVDVIAIHPNHGEALESVLGAARGVGIRICTWGCELSEECFDWQAESSAEVPEGMLELLNIE